MYLFAWYVACGLCDLISACQFDSAEDEEDHTGQVGTEIYMSPELVSTSTFYSMCALFLIITKKSRHNAQPFFS